MSGVPQNKVIAELPAAELQADLDQVLQPLLQRLLGKRLWAVGKQP